MGRDGAGEMNRIPGLLICLPESQREKDCNRGGGDVLATRQASRESARASACVRLFARVSDRRVAGGDFRPSAHAARADKYSQIDTAIAPQGCVISEIYFAGKQNVGGAAHLADVERW